MKSNPGVHDSKINFRRRIAGSFTNLRFQDSSVDALVSHFDFLYLHGRALLRATTEIIRLLKPNGTAYIYMDGYLGEEHKLDDLGVSYVRRGSEDEVFWWLVISKTALSSEKPSS